MTKLSRRDRFEVAIRSVRAFLLMLALVLLGNLAGQAWQDRDWYLFAMTATAGVAIVLVTYSLLWETFNRRD